MNGLVLSGGGGKGAYQIGVWKALRKLNYKIDVVTGTSVGAINAVLVTQNSYLLAPLIWNNIDFSAIFKEDIGDDYTTGEVIKMYGKNIIKNHGMNVDKLEKKISLFINYNKFIKSKIKFGIVTYNLTTLKPKMITKENITREKLKDYVIASATCFPAFKLKNIDGDKYIDGGYYDVLPINLAIKLGATDIIAVDLKTIGIRRKIKEKNVNVRYICPNNYIGSLFVFDKNINKRNICYGYNDTLKSFGKLEGNKYTFKKGDLFNIHKKYHDIFINNFKHFLKIKKRTSIPVLNKFIELDVDTKELCKIVEYLGKYFKIPDYKIYSLKTFNYLLIQQINNCNYVAKKTLSISKSDALKEIYFGMINNNSNIKSLAVIYPKDYICATYLYTIINGDANGV